MITARIYVLVLLTVLAFSSLVHAQDSAFGVFEDQVSGLPEGFSLALDSEGLPFADSPSEIFGMYPQPSPFMTDDNGRSLGVIRGLGVSALVLVSADGTLAGSIRRDRCIPAFALDGDRCACIDSEGTLELFDLKAVENTASRRSVDFMQTSAHANAFPGAQGLAFDGDGGLWIADTDRHRIVHVDSDGNVVKEVGDRGAFPGLFKTPSGIAVRDGKVYVADTHNHRIAVHDGNTGDFLYQWGMHSVVPREGEGRIHYPESIAVSPDGSGVFVYEPFERRYQRFSTLKDGEKPESTLPSRTLVESHFGPQLGVDGDLLVLQQPENGSASVFDLRSDIPIFITTFGRPGTGGSQFGRIQSIAVDSNSQEIWFLDAGNQRVSVWALNRDREARVRQDQFMAQFVRSISFASIAQDLKTAYGVEGFIPSQVLFRDGMIYMLDEHGMKVAKMTPDLEITGVFSFSPPNGQVGHIQAISSGGEGSWNTTTSGNYLLAFDAQGNPLGSGIKLDGDQGLSFPYALATLADGRMVVSDRAADHLRVINPDGSIERQPIGEPGSWDGALWWPGEIQPFSNGRVVVVDQGNHRAQVFDPETGKWSMTFSLGMAHNQPKLLREDFMPQTEEGK